MVSRSWSVSMAFTAVYVILSVLRMMWDPQTFQEQPFDIEHAREVFAEANKRLGSFELSSD